MGEARARALNKRADEACTELLTSVLELSEASRAKSQEQLMEARSWSASVLAYAAEVWHKYMKWLRPQQSEEDNGDEVSRCVPRSPGTGQARSSSISKPSQAAAS